MIEELLSSKISDALKSLKKKDKMPDVTDVNILVEKPTNRDFGDFSTNIAFLLAKKNSNDPACIAELLAEELLCQKPKELARITTMGGYVNFRLSRDFLIEQLNQIGKAGKKFGRQKIGKNKKIILEFSQPNIAKPLHAGHLRNTVLGDSLANLFEMAGYKVVRWNYLGDWGAQFGRVIAAYKLWGDKNKIKGDAVKELAALYIKFSEEEKTKPELTDMAREEFKKLESGDKENRKLWQWFRKESLCSLGKIYKLLGIKFDNFTGESFFEKDLPALLSYLKNEGVATAGEGGSLIVNLDQCGLPPALVMKSDGTSLYLTRDIANLEYRLKKYRPYAIFYVVGNEQTLYFKQLVAIADILSWNRAEIKHINYGLVLGSDRKKLSTRKGHAVTVEEIIEKTLGLADQIVREKNPSLSKKEYQKIAKTVALGALKYELLKDHRDSNIVFEWDKMLDFSGNSGPYLQYTYARLSSILRKAGSIGRSDFNLLADDRDLALIKHLLDFPDVIKSSLDSLSTNNLALFLYKLSNLANAFYESVPILKDGNEHRQNARLFLISTVANVLKNGLGLLGISVLEKI